MKGLGAVLFFHAATALVSYFFPPHTEEALNECLLGFAFEILRRTISVELFEPLALILF